MTPPDVQLFPFQEAFRDSFLDAGVGARQMLVAPSGMGKGYVAQVIAHQVVGTSHGKALVLAPAMLTEGFALGLRRFDPSYPVERFDRRGLREALSDARDEEIWRSPSIVIMSIEFARQEDVAPLLVGTSWSLVVVDEAHSLRGARRRLVQELADATDRLLLLSALEVEREADRLPGVEVVRWSRDVVDASGQRLLVATPRELHVVDYARTPQEVAFIAAVREQLRDDVDGSPQVELMRRMLLSALASSRSAIEEMLLRQLDRLSADYEIGGAGNGIAAEDAPAMDVWDEPGSLEVAPGASLWKDGANVGGVLADLVAQLDALPGDSKAAALCELAASLIAAEEPALVCVFCSFAATAEYLAEILGELADVFVVTGAMTSAARSEAVATFLDGGGVLIGTQIVQGLNLARSHLAVHYDLPEGHLQMEQRWGRLDRIGQRSTVRAFAFRDELRTLDLEETRLRTHGFV